MYCFRCHKTKVFKGLKIKLVQKKTFLFFLWAFPKGRAFHTRFLCVPYKRAQTNAAIANAFILANF